ncbi:MAG: hypothetical protein JXR70_09090 [Spirochaetales bacterium]|nr:hypothetical protein [Spirochaetales bacterium]
MNMEKNDNMRDDYDFSQLQSLGKGIYADKYKKGTNLIHLDSDVASFFHDDKSVNDALRLLISLARNQVSSQ